MALPISSSYRIFWTGKYLERAEVVARLLDEKLLNSPSASGSSEEMIVWGEMLKSFGVYSEYVRRHGNITAPDVLKFFVLDENCPSSILHCILLARENSSGAMPDEIFVAVNKLHLKLKDPAAAQAIEKDPHGFLEEVIRICMQVVGIVNHLWG